MRIRPHFAIIHDHNSQEGVGCMLGGKVLHDQRKMFIAYLSAALLIVLLITAVMYANTTTLVRRQHRESAQETARAQ